MGVEVIAVSKARRVACNPRTCEHEGHYQVGSYAKRRDSLRSGCYVLGKGGRSFWMAAGSYLGYDQWRTELSWLALDAAPEDVWAHPRRYRGQPFVELVDFTDGVGPVIGPQTSAKLYRDFVRFARPAKERLASPSLADRAALKPRKANKKNLNRLGALSVGQLAKQLGVEGIGDDDDEPDWMWGIYRDFRRAFKLAQDQGFVQFC